MSSLKKTKSFPSPEIQPFDYKSKYTKVNFVTGLLIHHFFEHIQNLLERLDLNTAIEVGCGEGFSTSHLKKNLPSSCSLKAYDVEQRLIEAAQNRNADVPISLGNIYSLPEPDASADMVFALEVLEHLTNPEAALKELCRISRRYLLLSVPREPLWRILNLVRLKYVFEWGNTPGHIQHWSKKRFLDFLSSSTHPLTIRSPLPWTIVLVEKQKLPLL